MKPSFPSTVRFGVIVVLGLLFGGRCFAEDVLPSDTAPAEEAMTSPEAFAEEAPLPAEEESSPRPAWLEKAEAAHGEAVAALEAGDLRLARRRLAKTLKLLSGELNEPLFRKFKDEVTAFLSRVEDEVSPLPEPEQMAPPDTLTVTAQELRAAHVEGPFPSSGTLSSYAMDIDPNDPLVKKYISLYTENPRRRRSLQEAFDRMAHFREMIEKEIAVLKVPRELLYLPLVESEYQTRAVSRARAMGLWQFMTVTGRNMGLDINYWVDERLDPVKSTKAALRHLKDLHSWFRTWPLALAAYNRGMYGLQRDLEFTRSPDFSSVSDRGGLPGETEQYVPKFMALTLIADNAAAYGFTIPDPVPPARVDVIELPKPLDLKIAASCAGTTEEVIRELNPSLRLWCTPKDLKSFALSLPEGTRKKVLACLENTKDWTPATGIIKYRVSRGDYLGRIASRFKTTVGAIMKDNRIANAKRLRVGQVLQIRPGRGYRHD